VLAVTGKRQAGLLRDALGGDVRHVEFRDASAWYGSLSGAATGYLSLVRERFEAGAPWIRIIGEPVWMGQSDEELAEWFRYEALINLSFAAFPTTVVCTYDTRVLSTAAIDDARRTHPEVTEGGVVTASPTYRHPEEQFLTHG
jgi:hypothetical protein